MKRLYIVEHNGKHFAICQTPQQVKYYFDVYIARHRNKCYTREQFSVCTRTVFESEDEREEGCY